MARKKKLDEKMQRLMAAWEKMVPVLDKCFARVFRANNALRKARDRIKRIDKAIERRQAELAAPPEPVAVEEIDPDDPIPYTIV